MDCVFIGCLRGVHMCWLLSPGLHIDTQRNQNFPMSVHMSICRCKRCCACGNVSIAQCRQHRHNGRYENSILQIAEVSPLQFSLRFVDTLRKPPDYLTTWKKKRRSHTSWQTSLLSRRNIQRRSLGWGTSFVSGMAPHRHRPFHENIMSNTYPWIASGRGVVISALKVALLMKVWRMVVMPLQNMMERERD